MGSISFAISIHRFVSSTGADAGFAAIVGLAILILLYFAQARETATLREQAAEAAERVGQLEDRIAELSRQAAAQAPAPAPEAVRPAAAAGATVASAMARPRIHLGPPAGVAAPALAAATRLIPLPTDNGVGEAVEWPGEPIKVHRAATEAPAPPSTVARGNGNGQGRVPPVPAAPRRRLEPAQGAAANRPSGASRRPILPPEPPSRRRSPVGKVLVALLGVLVLGAAVAAVLIVTSNKSSTDSSTVGLRTTNEPGTRRPVAFNPRTVTVAVLNGTGTTGLAHRTALRLTSAGYRQGTVATATDQTRTTTQVAFLPGYRNDAMRVASTLKLPSGSVQPIDTGTRAVACPPPAACTTNVVVTVGSDLATTG
jgi:hypothetical protein